MKVRQLIEFLQNSDPEALVVANLTFSGLAQITAVERKNESNIYLWESVPVVELSNGVVTHMRSQGRDVDGVSEIFTKDAYKAL